MPPFQQALANIPTPPSAPPALSIRGSAPRAPSTRGISSALRSAGITKEGGMDCMNALAEVPEDYSRAGFTVRIPVSMVDPAIIGPNTVWLLQGTVTWQGTELLGVHLYVTHPSQGLYARGNAGTEILGAGYAQDRAYEMVASLTGTKVDRAVRWHCSLRAWPRGLEDDRAIFREMIELRNEKF